jgi:hypothetical protein
LHCGAHPLLSLLGEKPLAPSFFILRRNIALWACKTPQQPKLLTCWRKG